MAIWLSNMAKPHKLKNGFKRGPKFKGYEKGSFLEGKRKQRKK